MTEPLTVQGFYATRVAARRVGRFVMLTALVALSLLLGACVIAATVIDILFVSWRLS
jgi:hypothetical protein